MDESNASVATWLDGIDTSAAGDLPDGHLSIERRPRTQLRRSALAASSRQMGADTQAPGKLRQSELKARSPRAASIVTMENADLDEIVIAFAAVLRAYCADAAAKPRQLAAGSALFDEAARALDASGQWRHVPKQATVEAFVRTVQLALELDEASLVIGLVLLERAIGGDEGLAVTARTWRPAALLAIIVASKVVYDEKVFLADYRDMLPELALDGLAAQEIAFLRLVGYNTSVRRAQYAKYFYALQDVARRVRAGQAR
jgi:hypothetical protein